MKYFILLILVSVFNFISVHCQDKAYERMKNQTSLDGLGGESVFKIFKDSRGLIWLGTNSGISCYNGHSFTNFTTGEKKKRNIVNSIVETKDNEILVGTQDGLYKIDKTDLKCKRIYDEIEDVNAICQMKDFLLVGGNKGLWLINKEGETKSLPIESSVISKANAVNDMAPDGDKAVWITTNERIVHLELNGLNFSKYDIPKSILTGYLGRICLINNFLYIGTRNSGLLKYDIKQHKTSKYIDVNSKVIIDINTDGKNWLYVSTDGSGAYLIDVKHDNIIKTFNTTNGELPSDAVYTYWHDTELDINWFGFFLDGFSHDYHVTPHFSIYKYKEFDSSKLPIRSFCIQNDMKVIGTRNGLYFIDEGRDIIRYYDSNEVGGNIITNIKYFGGNFVIANYERGLSVLNPQTLELNHLTTNEALRSGNFSRLCISPDKHHLFAISNMGVLILDENLNVVKHFNSRNSELPDTYLSDILFDKSGKAWISSLNYMCVYDPLLQTIQSSGFPKDFFNKEPQLRFNLCDNGDVIAYSETEVYRSKADFSQYEYIDIYDRLNIGSISFIYYFNDYYWIGTNKGLFCFDKSFNEYIHFSESDNLPSLSFNAQECQSTPDGSIWFGNRSALLYITPEQQKQIRTKLHCKVIIDHMSIDGKDLGASVPINIANDKRISLSWNFGSEVLSFTPILLNYSHDRGRYYEWNIDNGDFSSCSDGEEIKISSLGLGTHEIKIRLVGHEETEMTLQATVLPSFMFYIEVILLLVVIIILVQFIRIEVKRKRLRNKINEKHKIEIDIAARTAVEQHKIEEEEKKRIEEEIRIQEMYKRHKLSDEECRSLFKKVKTFVEDNKLYTNPSLRIGDIATGIDSTPNKLSQMFTQYAHTNFAEFINTYRIAEFKRRIEDKKFNNYTIIALAELCGLRRSTFFAAFKKIEGCTPLEYLQRKGIER